MAHGRAVLFACRTHHGKALVTQLSDERLTLSACHKTLTVLSQHCQASL